MFVLYYFLAQDEERRMIARYGESYKEYISKTGMFTPQFIDKWFSAFMPNKPARFVVVPTLTVAIVMGTGFFLRELTLHSLPFVTQSNVTLVSILPEDSNLDKSVLGGIAKLQSNNAESILTPDKDYLGYLMPADYVMQGMIANTGSDFHLFKQHNTIVMITEWVLHPFEHLRASPSLHMAQMHNVNPAIARRHHCPIGIDDSTMECGTCPYRRVILVEIGNPTGQRYSGPDLLSFNTTRLPVCYIDINALTGEILNVQQVEKVTAWQDVPTPAI